jgi:Flp pilus assembly protein TadG
MTAVMMPALLGAAGLAIDAGVWYREAARLQLAADAGAMGAARLLAQTTGTSAYQAAALIEVQSVTGSSMVGSITTPVTVSVAASYTQVTVTLTSTANIYLVGAIGVRSPTMTASATAGLVTTLAAPCVEALNTTVSDAIQVDNMGSIVANGCPVFSNSSAGTSIYLNSGTIQGSSIGAVGGVVESNSGSNTMSPSGNSNQSAQSNPESGLTVPNYGSCTTNGNVSYTSSGTYHFKQSNNVFCGNVTIGGNGSTDSFDAGTYYVINGNLTFTNANITLASGVNFVLAGTSPGTFTWGNNSNGTITAPTSGSLAGILIWQVGNSSCSDGANTFNGSSTLTASGTIYMPCGALNINNNAKIATASGASLGIIANTIYASGSGSSVSTTSSGSSGSSTKIVLLQ